MKRAQSSFEYLSTYVWAIFSILLFLGIFFYFDFSSVSLPDTCDAGSDFQCNQFVHDLNGSFAFELLHQGRTDINITRVDCFPDEVYSSTRDFNHTFSLRETAVIVCDADQDLGPRPILEAVVYYNYDEVDSLPRTTLVSVRAQPTRDIIGEYLSREITESS